MGYITVLISILITHAWITVHPPAMLLVITLFFLHLSVLMVFHEVSWPLISLVSLFLSLSVTAIDSASADRGLLPLVPQSVISCTFVVLEDSNLSDYGAYMSEVTITSISDVRGVRATCCYQGLLFSDRFLFQGEKGESLSARVKQEDGCIFVSAREVVMEDPPVLISFRSLMKEKIHSLLSPLKEERRGCIELLLFSYPSEWGNAMVEKGRAKGVSHLFVLSGFHLQLIVRLIELLTGKGKSNVIILVLAHLFVAVAGYTPSLTRALISMTLCRSASFTLSPISLITTLIIHGLLFPHHLFSFSAALSYTAVGAIILIYPKVQALLFPLLPLFILSPISLSLSAFSAASLVSFPLFGELHPEGILYTLFLSPLILPLFALTGMLMLLPFRPILFLQAELFEAVSYILSLPDIPPLTTLTPLITASCLFLTCFLLQWYCSSIAHKRSIKSYELDISLRLAFRNPSPSGREFSRNE